MEYTGNRAIDNIRKETELLANKTLSDRRERMMLSLGIRPSEVETVMSNTKQIAGT